MGKKVCAECGNAMIGGARARYCSPACKQRAYRGRRVTVTAPGSYLKCDPVSVKVDVTDERFNLQLSSRAHSAGAVALLKRLDAELAENAKRLGRPLKWSASESAILELAADTIDRRDGLQGLYEAAKDEKLRLKVAGELRLIEAALARLLAKIKTDLPAPQSTRSRKAADAARVRWDSASN